MKALKLTLIFIFGLTSIAGYCGTGEWKLEKNSLGIKVYTRTVDGEDIREFKATTTIEAPRKTIAALIINVNDYVNWYPDISEAYIFKKLSATEYYVYNILDLPWPASDRDGVSKMTIIKTDNTTTINMKSIDGQKAEKAGLVRIPRSYGFWKLETKGTKTHVHFQYFASPGGSLPDWIINMFIVDNPYDTLIELKRKAVK